jgi:hypothetical protein
MSKCSSCGAEIRWVKTGRGKNMPLDCRPSDHGNVVIQKDGAGNEVAHVVADRRDADAHRALGHPTYTSHFASCPQAAKHRRTR